MGIEVCGLRSRTLWSTVGMGAMVAVRRFCGVYLILFLILLSLSLSNCEPNQLSDALWVAEIMLYGVVDCWFLFVDGYDTI